MTTPLTRGDIASGLRALGLGEGDTVLLHSSLSSLGQVAGGAESVVDACLEVVGQSGTLVVPIFGSLGAVTDIVRGRESAVCSVHPKAAVAALGARAEAICADHWKAELAHGPDTPYTRIAEMGGYVCLLGVDQDRNTTWHTVEEMLRLPYLQTTEACTFSTPEGEVTRSWDLFPGPHRDFIGLDRALREGGHMKVGRIGGAVVRLMPGAELVSVGQRLGSADPAFALCDNPRCEDCVEQRAHLRRARLEPESFTLVAAASLAGHYAEEIADRCMRAGVPAVELDCVRGRPVSVLSGDEMMATVESLRAAGCQISSLRLPAPPSELEPLLNVALELAIDRVVLPLGRYSLEQARQADEVGVAVSFGNVAMGSEDATALLQEMSGAGLKPRFTFSAAGFARTGEKPFLESWRQRLKHRVDQLDVEDACFDGTPAALGQGNAEIAELVSILRCASFAGPLVLGSGNRAVGSLEDAAGAFHELLSRI